MTSSARVKLVAILAGASALSLWVAGSRIARAHCDTMDGPVIADARAALEKGDVTPALKWIPAGSESEIRQSFQRAMIVRTKGPEAKELADMHFFETLVRVHRAAEGAPYTGLKPAGTKLEPGVAEADRAIASGKVDALVDAATEAVAAGIRQRFARVAESRAHAGHNVAAGREYVAAYVEFVHYVERIFADAASDAHGHGEAGKAGEHAAHEHGKPEEGAHP